MVLVRVDLRQSLPPVSPLGIFEESLGLSNDRSERKQIMAMVGNVDDLINRTPASNRLMRGLLFLRNYLEGRAPEITTIVTNLKLGEKIRVPLDGDSLYALIEVYNTRELEKAKFEAHEHHTDVQYICDGREWIAVCDLRKQDFTPAYDQNGNVFFPLGNQPSTRLLLERGDIAVLFPNDAHAPCLRVEGGGDPMVCKIVVKVEDAHLMAQPTHTSTS